METPVKIGFAVAVLIAFAVSAKVLRDRVPEAQGQVKLVARLDEYTIKEGPGVKNAIPSFLELPGNVGILPAPVAPPADATVPASPATPAAPAGGTPVPEAAPPPAAEPPSEQPILITDIKPIVETELQKGYCTASLTKLVRQRYPGTYDGIPDEDLEKSVLKQHPEYKGRICVFPAWITASPHTIIKYDIERGVKVIPASIWLWSGGIAAVFGMALFAAHKRFVEAAPKPKPAARPARSSSRPPGRA
jgi:hypothetical protein